MERKEGEREADFLLSAIFIFGIGSKSNWSPMYDIGLATKLFLYAMAI